MVPFKVEAGDHEFRHDDGGEDERVPRKHGNDASGEPYPHEEDDQQPIQDGKGCLNDLFHGMPGRFGGKKIPPACSCRRYGKNRLESFGFIQPWLPWPWERPFFWPEPF